MTEDLLAKAKETQSPEELLTLMRENGSEEFTMENAEALYAQIHTSGELTDEEMEAVTGGSHTKVNGQKYLVVTSGLHCKTGQYELGVTQNEKTGDYYFSKADHITLRFMWQSFSDDNQCGQCSHLSFTKSGTGYCDVSNG